MAEMIEKSQAVRGAELSIAYLDGKDEGEARKALEVAKKLIKRKMALNDVAEVTGLDISTLKKLKAEDEGLEKAILNREADLPSAYLDGSDKGEREVKVVIAKKLIKRKTALEFIATTTGLDIPTLKKLKAEEDALEKAIAIRDAELSTAFLDGKDEGRVEGKTEGKIEGKTEVAQMLIKMKMAIEDIAIATGLDIPTLQKLKVKAEC